MKQYMTDLYNVLNSNRPQIGLISLSICYVGTILIAAQTPPATLLLIFAMMAIPSAYKLDYKPLARGKETLYHDTPTTPTPTQQPTHPPAGVLRLFPSTLNN